MAIARVLGRLVDRMRRWVVPQTVGLLLGDIAPPSWQRQQPLDAIAAQLSAAGWARYDSDSGGFLEEGIELLESSWVLARNGDTACRLGAMYERDNRSSDCTALYREAIRRFPEHKDLRCQAAAHFLRHTGGEEIRCFVEFVRAIDACDPFASYVSMMMDAHVGFATSVHKKVAAARDSREPVLMCFPVWGEEYVRDFIAYACGSLLAPGNLPAAAKRYSFQIVVFTTSSGEAAIRGCAVFEQLALHATVHFLHFPIGADGYAGRMMHHYGRHLGELYSRACKFQLFSASHYATLEAGRRLGAMVMPLAADNVFSDGSLEAALGFMDGPVDVVAVTGFRLKNGAALDEMEARYRSAVGVLQIPQGEHSRIVANLIPRELFVDADRFASFPLMLCWQVDDRRVLVHSTHYHPFCIRASALQGSLEFTIDPVDGRFLGRHLPDPERIHIVKDMAVAISDWSASPLFESAAQGSMTPEKMSRFLWMYWDGLRDRYFRAAIRIGEEVSHSSWSEAERLSLPVVEEILSGVSRREERHKAQSSWTRIYPR